MPATTRADGTRARILTAARGRFAAGGFRSATIRAIAGDAGIDPALVMRYFGSKADLFAAVIDVDLAIPQLGGVPADEHGERLVAHFLARWDDETPEGDMLLTLLRSAATDPDAASRMRDLFAAQLVPALRPLIRRRSEVAQRVGLIATQMLGLALTRFVLELPPVTGMSSRAVVRNVGSTIQRYLHDPLPS